MDLQELLTQLALMAVSAIASWAVWISKQILHVKKDLDAAFQKLRGIDARLSDQDFNRPVDETTIGDFHCEACNCKSRSLGENDR